jgi:hypothetical protein
MRECLSTSAFDNDQYHESENVTVAVEIGRAPTRTILVMTFLVVA